MRAQGTTRPGEIMLETDAAEGDLEDDVVGTLEREARGAALAWALDQLPSEDRLLLHLRIGEGLSYDDLAQVLETNSRTLGTRLYRARARLHRLLVERLGDAQP